MTKLQSKLQSLAEQVARACTAFLSCSLLTLFWVPFLGVPSRFMDSLIMSIPYVALSLCIGYFWRRIFERWKLWGS